MNKDVHTYVGGDVAVWQCITVYYGMMCPVQHVCLVKSCSSATKLIVLTIILCASIGVCPIALSQLPV